MRSGILLFFLKNRQSPCSGECFVKCDDDIELCGRIEREHVRGLFSMLDVQPESWRISESFDRNRQRTIFGYNERRTRTTEMLSKCYRICKIPFIYVKAHVIMHFVKGAL